MKTRLQSAILAAGLSFGAKACGAGAGATIAATPTGLGLAGAGPGGGAGFPSCGSLLRFLALAE